MPPVRGKDKRKVKLTAKGEGYSQLLRQLQSSSGSSSDLGERSDTPFTPPKLSQRLELTQLSQPVALRQQQDAYKDVIVLSSGSESDPEEDGERVERTLFVGQGKGKAKAKGKAQAKAKAKGKGKARVQPDDEEMADGSEGERAGDDFYELTPQLPPRDDDMDNDEDDPTGAEATEDEKEE
jgi:hypothetical protein